jgi:hypothetical protein
MASSAQGIAADKIWFFGSSFSYVLLGATTDQVNRQQDRRGRRSSSRSIVSTLLPLRLRITSSSVRLAWAAAPMGATEPGARWVAGVAAEPAIGADHRRCG